MYTQKNIAENIYYVGVNDREKHLFENYIPLPYGVSYNSYLIKDEKVALIDTVEVSFSDIFFRQIDAILQGRPIDYLVVNHMEPDHAGSIGLIAQRYPDMKIVGNKKTFEFLNGYFNVSNEMVVVEEGGELVLGQHKLNFYMAPMVHWPEVMVAYEPNDRILFSADAFGTFGALNGSFRDCELNLDHFWDEMRRYYACIVGKYGAPVQTALKKLSALPIKTVCATHGPVWHDELPKVIGLYDQWSKYETEKGCVIAYGSMYGNTQQLAESIAQGLADGGIKNIVIHDVSKSDASFILADIFQYNGLILGSPTYMNGLYPLIDSLVHKIEERGIKNHIYSCFGSHTWAGTATKRLRELADKMRWTTVGTPVDNRRGVDLPTLRQAYELGLEMAKVL